MPRRTCGAAQTFGVSRRSVPLAAPHPTPSSSFARTASPRRGSARARRPACRTDSSIRCLYGRIMDVGDWLSSGIALLALAVAVTGLLYARRSAAAAEVSARAGQRSAAAELAASHGSRSAEAAERSADAAEAMVPAVPPPVRWRFERGPKSLHVLRNVGEEPATSVSVVGLPRDAAALVQCAPPERVSPMESVGVMIMRVSGPTVRSLEVRCAEAVEPTIVAVT